MRTRIRGALVMSLMLALPATAHAATATISNADGADVALGAPVTVDTMTPTLKVTFADTEKRYALKVTGPAGADAAPALSCRAVTEPTSSTPVTYQGNGNYTVSVTTSPASEDINCAAGQTSTFQFAVTAAATVTASPKGLVLTRLPDESDLVPHTFKFAASAGADQIEIAYGRGLDPADTTLQPVDVVPVSDPSKDISFAAPGTYQVLVRPKLGDAVGPWSAPVDVKVKDPFDFKTAPQFSDFKGPTYAIKGDVRASLPKKSRIKVTIAKGKKGGKFGPLKTIRTKKGGRFKLKFDAATPGRYRLRYHFNGNGKVAAGEVTQLIKIQQVVV